MDYKQTRANCEEKPFLPLTNLVLDFPSQCHRVLQLMPAIRTDPVRLCICIQRSVIRGIIRERETTKKGVPGDRQGREIERERER